MIFGPQHNHSINRIQPIDPDRQEEDLKKKKRVLYQGRAWGETEEELPVQPSIPQKPQNPEKAHPGPVGVYVDRAILAHAEGLFLDLTTLQEKVAQLCFLANDAIYDMELQKEVELLIQTWQIGGVLFHKGEYRRQAYLTERYQELSKTPLLFANDFAHGLSFYLQGDPLPSGPISQQHYSDLGKAVMAQNRRLGVHVQFDRERGVINDPMTEVQAKAFRQGVRSAHGIVGKGKCLPQQDNYPFTAKGGFSLLSLKGISTLSSALGDHVQENIGFKTLTFFDAGQIDQELLGGALESAFKGLYDVFLFNNNITHGIRSIAGMVASGKLSEATLDRHVMKALIIKSYFFK